MVTWVGVGNGKGIPYVVEHATHGRQTDYELFVAIAEHQHGINQMCGYAMAAKLHRERAVPPAEDGKPAEVNRKC